jgi:hypothetical protein
MVGGGGLSYPVRARIDGLRCTSCGCGDTASFVRWRFRTARQWRKRACTSFTASTFCFRISRRFSRLEMRPEVEEVRWSGEVEEEVRWRW